MNGSLSYQVTINDTSPLLQFSPNWLQCFEESGCTPSAAGDSGWGQSYHSANGSDVTFALSFTGDGIELYGAAVASSLATLTIDDSPVYLAPAGWNGLDTLLVKVEALPTAEEHTLILRTASGFSFTRAVVSFASQQLNIYSLQCGDSAFHYSGSWTTPAAGGVPNAPARTNEIGATAGLNFTGVGIIVYASVEDGHGAYNMTLDGQTFQLNATGQQWLVTETIIYYAVHLKYGRHTLIMTNNGGYGSTTLTLNSVTILQLDSTAMSELDPGVPDPIGLLFFFLVLAMYMGGMVVCAWLNDSGRRRRSLAAKRSESSPLLGRPESLKEEENGGIQVVSPAPQFSAELPVNSGPVFNPGSIEHSAAAASTSTIFDSGCDLLGQPESLEEEENGGIRLVSLAPRFSAELPVNSGPVFNPGSIEHLAAAASASTIFGSGCDLFQIQPFDQSHACQDKSDVHGELYADHRCHNPPPEPEHATLERPVAQSTTPGFPPT